MPESRPFLTVRRLTIATAIITLLALTALEFRRRRAVFHAQAVRYGRLERSPFIGPTSMTYDQYLSMQRLWPRLKPYYAKMKEKYQYAERHPWLPVEPDPPKPK